MADADGSQQSRKRRATKACEFCRKRKMKCDDDRPRCANCRLYGKECQYAELPRKFRPLSDRLTALEEENRNLQARLRSTPLDESFGEPRRNSNSNQSDAASAARQSDACELTASSITSSAARLVQDEARETPSVQISTAGSAGLTSHTNYYGRTSALFDEEPVEGRVPGPSRQAAEFTRRQLLGQLENLNYKQGKLDFDSIDPEVGMHLLSLHWNRQHHSHLITYRPAFMRDMACKGPYFSKLLLNAIYFGSCKFSPREDLKGIHTRFRERVRELLGGALDRSSITTIQAMLVMTNSLFALGDERSAAWIYAGIAFRMLIDLGAHVDGVKSRISEEDLEIRRRVFWGAFVVDKIQSLYQGRPVSIRYSDIRVPIVFQDQYEELEYWAPFAYPDTAHYPGSPAYSVSTFTELCKLSVIMNDILDSVYGVKSSKQEPRTLNADLEKMQDDLENWKAALPPHLDFDPRKNQTVPPPHVLSLLAMYNVLLILLHRPFVSEGHLHSTSSSTALHSFSICTHAATRTVELLRTYEKTFSIRHAPYLIAYATYVAATIHVRIAAQLGPGSDAYNSLRTCCSVFAKNQDTNWAARRAQTVIVNLMKKMNIELAVDEEATPNSQICVDGHILSSTEPKRHTDLQKTGTGEGRNAQTTNSDSPSHDSVVSLDMAAIVQSFVTEQQAVLNDMPPLDLYRLQQQPGILPTSQQIYSGDPYAQQWGMLDMTGNQLLDDDALFGFNGAAFDGVWQ